jgi:hypothetical protein
MVPETNPTVRGPKVKTKSAIIRVPKAVIAVRVVQVLGAEEMAVGAAAPVDSAVAVEAASAVAVDLEAVAAVAETTTAETITKERATTSNFQRKFPTFSITSTSIDSVVC